MQGAKEARQRQRQRDSKKFGNCRTVTFLITSQVHGKESKRSRGMQGCPIHFRIANGDMWGDKTPPKNPRPPSTALFQSVISRCRSGGLFLIQTTTSLGPFLSLSPGLEDMETTNLSPALLLRTSARSLSISFPSLSFRFVC